MLSTPQTVIVSGASSGIGAEVARRFSAEGYDVLLLGRDEGRLKKIQSECAGNTHFLAFDLKKISDHAELIRQKLSSLPPLSVLVNNAGIYKEGLLEDTDDEIWIDHFQVNLLAAVQLARLAWPVFKKNRRGSVVNVSSTLGLKPTANTAAYSASKAAMVNWTQSLAQEGGPFGIRVNCVCPGIVDTPIHEFHSLPPQKKMEITRTLAGYQLLDYIGQPPNVAEAVYFLASDLSKWTTGSILTVDGGINLK